MKISQLLSILVSFLTLVVVSCTPQESITPSPDLPKAPDNSSVNTPDTPITEITIEELSFKPAAIEVPVGSTVTWYNQDSIIHTVTLRDNSVDSGNLATDETFSYTFTQLGTYNYYCTIHPFMEGTIVVR